MNKIENLFNIFNSGVKKIYICEFCGDVGSIEHLIFRGKMSKCCPECGKAFFKVYDWLDYILEMDNINKSKSISKSSKSLYSRRSKVKLILNKIIIEKIKDGKATKNIKCPMCKGKGHNGIF